MVCAKIILACLSLAVLVNGQVLKIGNCPDYKIAENFNPAKYFSGKFYEQKRFWAVFEIGTKCVNADYSAQENGTVKVENSAYSLKKKSRFSQVGEAYCENERKAACHVRFYPGAPYGDYNVIAADPEKYGLVYSCRQLMPGALYTQFAWILTREKNISQEEMNGYLNVFTQNGIDVNLFLDTIQDCKDN